MPSYAKVSTAQRLKKYVGSTFGIFFSTRRNCVLTWPEVSGLSRCYSHLKVFHKQRLMQRLDPAEAPRLTPQMVTSILKANEKVTKLANGVVKEVHSNQLQANKPIEDRHIEARLRNSEKYLFGVFDGHAGCACAQTLKERLLQYIAISMADWYELNWLYDNQMSAVSELLDVLPTSTVDMVSNDLASVHWQSAHRFIQDSLSMYNVETSVEETLTNAFMRLDKDISTEASISPGDKGLSADLIHIAFSGAVGCVAFIDGLDLYVANVGDCQAVIGSHSTESETWHASRVSNKHDAENDKEVKRLFMRHPNESSNILKNGRLFGELMPLRAFGDVRYKWEKRDLIHLTKIANQNSGLFLGGYRNLKLPGSYRTPPYLDAQPEVSHHRLSPKDKFLVLATDGLWDSQGMSIDKVVSLVGHHTEGQQLLASYEPPEDAELGAISGILHKRKQNLPKRAIDENVTTHLLRHSMGLEHGLVSAQLALPKSLVRSYRDDITITVIYFDHDYIMNYTHRQ